MNFLFDTITVMRCLINRKIICFIYFFFCKIKQHFHNLIYFCFQKINTWSISSLERLTVVQLKWSNRTVFGGLSSFGDQQSLQKQPFERFLFAKLSLSPNDWIIQLWYFQVDNLEILLWFSFIFYLGILMSISNGKIYLFIKKNCSTVRNDYNVHGLLLKKNLIDCS